MIRYSFVIPTYNNRSLLQNTLKALDRLNPCDSGEFEVVVVDDGSDDGTGEMVGCLDVKYPRIYLYLENTGESCRARTRNQGWRVANGEIVIFIDSDIMIRKDHLRELERCFTLDPDILVTGNRIMMGKQDSPEKFLMDPPGSCAEMELDNLEIRHFLYETLSYNAQANQFDWMQVYSCNMAVLKKNLDRVGGFDEKIKHWGMEDQELGCSLKKMGIRIVINSRLEVIHQYHGDRNDIVINKGRLPGFLENIDYFIAKHPDAVRINKKYLYKFLTGKIPVVSLPVSSAPLEWNFSPNDDLAVFKERILEIISGEKKTLIINDHAENTDLDVWIQLLGEEGSGIRYYPVSRKIPPEMMKLFGEKRKREEDDNRIGNEARE